MKRFPASATFELTARCNLQCGMCLVRVDEERIRDLGARELTADEWISLGRQAAGMGTINLLLTGGEPTLREDFCGIYEAFMRLGFVITLYTNAVALTPAVRKTLKRYPPHRVGVTVYGASEKTYARVCGVGHAYDAMLDGVRFLLTMPSQMEIRTTLVKGNIADMDAIRDLALSWGRDIPFVTTQVVSMAVRGGVADAAGCRLSPEENVRMLRDGAARLLSDLQKSGQDKRSEQIRRNLREASEASNNRMSKSDYTIFGCDAGVKEYTITWDGRLIGCQMMDEKGTLPLETGLQRAWDTYPDTITIQLPDEKCASCQWCGVCMACPATRLAETGSLDGAPEYNCKISELIYDYGKNRTDQGG